MLIFFFFSQCLEYFYGFITHKLIYSYKPRMDRWYWYAYGHLCELADKQKYCMMYANFPVINCACHAHIMYMHIQRNLG